MGDRVPRLRAMPCWRPPSDEPRYEGIDSYRLPTGWREDAVPRILLILAMLTFAVYYGRFALSRFEAFQAPGFDLGIFDQGVWLLSRFKNPFVTIMGLNLFGDHATYILFFLVPLYWVWPSAHVLLITQTLALAVSAIPVFLLARRALRSSWFALFPAIGFLLTPALGWLGLENYHPDSYEVPLLLFALYFMAERRWRPYFVMVALLLMVKEDVPFVVVPLGIYVAIKYHRRVGLTTAYLGALWFVVTVFFVQPLINRVGAAGLDAFRIPFGGLKGLIVTVLTEPWAVVAYMLTAEKVKYLFQMLVPVLFLPLFSSITLVVAPVVLLNLLSTFSYQWDIRYHYTSLLIAGFAGAAVFCLERLHDLSTRRALAVGLLFAGLFSAYVWGPSQWSQNPARMYDPRGPEAVALREAIALIPDDAVVSARSRYSSHLAHRERIYEFPNPFAAYYWGDGSLGGTRLPEADDVEYVLERPELQSGPSAEIWPTLAEEGFVEIFSENGVVLLRRAETPEVPGG